MLSNRFLNNLWFHFELHFWPDLKEIKDQFTSYVPKKKLKPTAESVKRYRNLTHNLSKF